MVQIDATNWHRTAQCTHSLCLCQHASSLDRFMCLLSRVSQAVRPGALHRYSRIASLPSLAPAPIECATQHHCFAHLTQCLPSVKNLANRQKWVTSCSFGRTPIPILSTLYQLYSVHVCSPHFWESGLHIRDIFAAPIYSSIGMAMQKTIRVLHAPRLV